MDVIKLLPDSVANQIAAGEVVQRPASAIKEMLENSLDAGATQIRVHIKGGGTLLMQVSDNGRGMSETDARMCWERHATSKISKAEDLFALYTYGFRGEALASIAGVAQVEMKTRREEDDAATVIRVEGSKFISQDICSAPVGTTISVKNLFFNIPARRNFLKSFSVESRHVIEEFQHQAIAHPQVAFELYIDDKEVHKLQPAGTEQRLREVFALKENVVLLPVEEDTEILKVRGYAGAPDSARRTRGSQLLFVNGRFLRSPYLNHAVCNAYEGLIDTGTFPFFVISLTVHPAKVDVNVHPTKTEVKFEDERHIYNILKAAVRKALGNFVLQPGMDVFGMGGLEEFLSKPLPHKDFQPRDFNADGPSIKHYNPFAADTQYQRKNQDWANFFGTVDQSTEQESEKQELFVEKEKSARLSISQDLIFQLHMSYVVAVVESELYVIDQKLAHERLLFEKYSSYLQHQRSVSQQLLFPRTLELNATDLNTVLEMMEDLKLLGFDISHFGGQTLVVNGLPPDLNQADEMKILEAMMEDYRHTAKSEMQKRDLMALSLARQASVNRNRSLDKNFMQALVEDLFSLPANSHSIDGKPIMIKIGSTLLFDLFRRRN